MISNASRLESASPGTDTNAGEFDDSEPAENTASKNGQIDQRRAAATRLAPETPPPIAPGIASIFDTFRCGASVLDLANWFEIKTETVEEILRRAMCERESES